MSEASEKARLIASDIENLRLHYALTLRHWLDRATKARAAIEAMYDARFFRMWEFYLAGGIVMFENGAACNYQVQYIRERTALPITRDYMTEAEATLPQDRSRATFGQAVLRQAQRRGAERGDCGILANEEGPDRMSRPGLPRMNQRGLTSPCPSQSWLAAPAGVPAGVIVPSWFKSIRSN